MTHSDHTTTMPRHDLYVKVHKALRAYMTDTLTAVGRMDCADPGEVGTTLGQVRELLSACRTHLELENRFIHPALEACAPGSSAWIASEHVEHEQAIDQLRAGTDRVETAAPDARPAAALRLYHQLALFVADNVQHMQVEETQHNAALWAGYTDDELATIEGALVQSIPPQKLMMFLRWMLPFVNHTERVRILSGMRATAPAAAFDAALALARGHLREIDWDKLAGALGINLGRTPTVATA